MKKQAGSIFILLMVFVSPGVLSAQLQIHTGVAYTTGEYGADTVLDETSALISLSYTGERLGWWVSGSYRSLTGVSVEPVSHNPNTPGAGQSFDWVARSSSSNRERGVGDAYAGVTLYDVARSRGGRFALDLTGRIKVGLADEDYLGTGTDAYAAEGNLYGFLDDFTVAMFVGYQVNEDGDNIALENKLYSSLMASRYISDSTNLGTYISIEESAIAGAPYLREWGMTLHTRADQHWRFGGQVFFGFSDSSPDWGVGVSTDFNF